MWEATKARNLLDSLYCGYPVGYLIAWRDPTVKLKDGTPSAGKRIPIDGQAAVTALMAAILGREVLTKDYETFNPQEQRPDRQRAWRRPLVLIGSRVLPCRGGGRRGV